MFRHEKCPVAFSKKIDKRRQLTFSLHQSEAWAPNLGVWCHVHSRGNVDYFTVSTEIQRDGTHDLQSACIPFYCHSVPSCWHYSNCPYFWAWMDVKFLFSQRRLHRKGEIAGRFSLTLKLKICRNRMKDNNWIGKTHATPILENRGE